MGGSYKIYAVDDDAGARQLLQSGLGSSYAMEVFDCGERCLERAAEALPDLFLLDVELPGLNGYQLCRRIKVLAQSARTPVVFVSIHDNLDAILAGYEAGGQDYIVKPYALDELKYKIENIRRIELHTKTLRTQAQSADALAARLMGNLDENAVLIKFLRALNQCGDFRALASGVLLALNSWHLDGALQIRMRHLEHTFSPSGENWPMEVEVINHVRSLEPVFQFKQRAAYNFEHITVLVTNMPLEDPERCARIHDHLALVAESAQQKLAALQAFDDRATLRDQIRAVAQTIGDDMESYRRRHDDARYQGSEHTILFLDDLQRAFSRLALSASQEDNIMNLVRERTAKLIELYDISGETRSTLDDLSAKLETILAATADRGGQA